MCGLAVQKLAQEAPGLTLQATALVQEAFVRFVEPAVYRHWDGRGYLFAARRRGDANARPRTRSRPGVHW